MNVKITLRISEYSSLNIYFGEKKLSSGNILIHIFVTKIDIYASIVEIQEVLEMSWNLGPPKCKSRRTSYLVCMQFAEMKLSQLCFEICESQQH